MENNSSDDRSGTFEVIAANGAAAADHDEAYGMTETEIVALLKDMFKLMNSLIKESERATAIIAGARLDVDLERLLKHILVSHAGGSDPLFDSDRVIGTFSAKIALSYRIGLIDAGFEHALQLVRKIRNDFADQLDEESFSSIRQRPRLVELVRWAKKSSLFDSAILLFSKTEKSTEHLEFTACISCMVIKLVGGLKSMQKIHIRNPLGHDASSSPSRVLLTANQYIEASIRMFLDNDVSFRGMNFMLELHENELRLVRLEKTHSEKNNIWRYPINAKKDGKINKEVNRITTLIKRDVLLG